MCRFQQMLVEQQMNVKRAFPEIGLDLDINVRLVAVQETVCVTDEVTDGQKCGSELINVHGPVAHIAAVVTELKSLCRHGRSNYHLSCSMSRHFQVLSSASILRQDRPCAVKGLRFASMNAFAGALDSAGRPGRQVHSAAPFGRRKKFKTGECTWQ